MVAMVFLPSHVVILYMRVWWRLARTGLMLLLLSRLLLRLVRPTVSSEIACRVRISMGGTIVDTGSVVRIFIVRQTSKRLRLRDCDSYTRRNGSL